MNEPANGTTVYIIDDEISVGRSLVRLMLSAGIRAQYFTSVEEFLDMNCLTENTCIVSDIRMPGMSGLELPASLEKIGKHIPVIFITAHDTPEMRTEALRIGAAGFLCKPVDGYELLDVINEALENRAIIHG